MTTLRPLRIAAIVRHLPVPIYMGLNLVVHNVLGGLACRRHDIQLYVLDPTEGAEPVDYFLRFSCAPTASAAAVSNDKDPGIATSRLARYYRTSSAKLGWLHRQIQEYAPDVVLGFAYDVAPYVALLPSRVPKAMDVVDSEPLFLWRQLWHGDMGLDAIKHLLAASAVASLYLRRCDAVVTVSEEDSRNLRRFSPHTRIETIPNGVDCEYFKPREAVARIPGRLVFTGSLNWPPNQAAVDWFLRSCWDEICGKRPDVSLTVIGKWGNAAQVKEWERFPNVRVLGFVPDIRDHVLQAEVSIAPMISGSGIKNKILEAWALGQPVVATTLASRGLQCRPEHDIILATSAKDFSASVLRLLGDANLRSRLGVAARANVVERYSWEQVTERFEPLLYSITSSPS